MTAVPFLNLDAESNRLVEYYFQQFEKADCKLV